MTRDCKDGCHQSAADCRFNAGSSVYQNIYLPAQSGMSIMHVPRLPCGKQGLQLSKQGLGCMGMSAFYGATLGYEEAAAVINRALELGVTHLDSATSYGWGENEKLVGTAVKGKREQFTIATKCGLVTKDGQMGFDASRKHVRQFCEASLQRLGVDTIDLFYLHRVDPNTPVEETFVELKALKDEGKIRYVGISEASPDDIRKAHAVCPLSAVQLEWSLWVRDCEADIVPVCRELGIGIVTYSPLGRGFLTGSINKPEDLDSNDWRHTQPWFQKDAFAKNMVLVEAVKHLAAKKGCTPGQLALAWVHAQGDDVFPIPGTRRAQYLEENVEALAVQLTKEDLQELDHLHTQVQGDRKSDMRGSYHYYKLPQAA